MIRKAVLTLIAKNYCNWLDSRLPPSGKPMVRPFEAEVLDLINALPPDEGPSIGEPSSLNETNVVAALEWIFATVADANTSNNYAKLFCHSARIDHLPNGREILDRILNVDRSLDSGHEIPCISPRKVDRS